MDAVTDAFQSTNPRSNHANVENQQLETTEIPVIYTNHQLFMDLVLVKEGFGHTQKRGKWVLLLAALGFTGYGAYNVYHLPYVAKKRKKLLKLLGALVSIAEAVSNSAEAVGVVSKDLKEFVQSDLDRIPNSVRQVSKVTRSEEFSESVVKVTRALTVGISEGYRSGTRKDDGMSVNSSFLDQVSDKLFSTAGSGFASVVVGSFAKHLVMAYSDFVTSNNSKSAVEWANVVCGEKKSRELIGDCIQLFVSTAVTVYLEKTMHINIYDELFSGLTNPKHKWKMKEMVASVCNGAVETLVKTSHQVLTSGSSCLKSNTSDPLLAINEFENQNSNEELYGEVREPIDENEVGGLMNRVSSTLAVPSNRKFVFDLTGKVAFETVKSLLVFLMEKLCESMRSSLNGAHEAVIDRSIEVVRFVTEKSSSFVNICVSMCLHILGGVWILVPA